MPEIQFDESRRNEFRDLDTGKAQAWLRGRGIESALVWKRPESPESIFVAVPLGTPAELCKQALRVGSRW